MRRIILATALSISALTLGACGSTTGDRAASGAGIGGAVGAGAGALTTEDRINFGKPIWR